MDIRYVEAATPEAARSWSIKFTSREEAQVVLETQQTLVGNQEMSPGTSGHWRIDQGIDAVKALQCAAVVLPEKQADGAGEEGISFTASQSQYIANVACSGIRRIMETGKPLTSDDELLAKIDSDIDTFF